MKKLLLVISYMGRCYSCGELSKETYDKAVRLGYLGNPTRVTKYQRWGMIMQQQEDKKKKAKENAKKNNIIVYKNGL